MFVQVYTSPVLELSKNNLWRSFQLLGEPETSWSSWLPPPVSSSAPISFFWVIRPQDCRSRSLHGKMQPMLCQLPTWSWAWLPFSAVWMGTIMLRVGWSWLDTCWIWQMEQLPGDWMPALHWVPSWMILLTSQPSGLPLHCSSGHLTCWTMSFACAMSCPCLSAFVSSQAGSPSCTVACPAYTLQPSLPVPLCCQEETWPCWGCWPWPWSSSWSVRTFTLMTECWSLRPGRKLSMLEESSWSFARPSRLPASTTCCGPFPTFCSRHPFGAVKCKGGPGFSPKLQTRFSPTSDPSGWIEASCCGGSNIYTHIYILMHHRPTLTQFIILSLVKLLVDHQCSIF